MTGGVGFLLMFGGAFLYVKIIDAPGALYAMLALSPTIPVRLPDVHLPGLL